MGSMALWRLVWPNLLANHLTAGSRQVPKLNWTAISKSHPNIRNKRERDEGADLRQFPAHKSQCKWECPAGALKGEWLRPPPKAVFSRRQRPTERQHKTEMKLIKRFGSNRFSSFHAEMNFAVVRLGSLFAFLVPSFQALKWAPARFPPNYYPLRNPPCVDQP